MIRGGTRFGHTARLLVCAVCAVAIAAPATASAQPAVDEYSLDIPGAGGSEPVDPNDPGGAGAVASGSGSGGDDSTSVSGGAGTGDAGTEGGQGEGEGEGGRAGSGEDVKYDNFHKGEDGIGSTSEPLDTTSRSAPEVVADTLLDSAMLPVLAALVVITGIGAWRVLRSRGTLSRQAG